MHDCCFHTGLSDFLYRLSVFHSNFTTMPCCLDSIMFARKLADLVLLHFPDVVFNGSLFVILQPHSSRTFRDIMNVQIYGKKIS
jgi:hypothetical protein